MGSLARDKLGRRAQKAILAHALFRPESGLTIALVILLAYFVPAPFAWWRWWFWVGLGALAEALIVYTTITDESAAQTAVAEMLRQAYHPPKIRSRRYREKVEQALDYREQIGRVLAETRSGILRDHLLDSTVGLADWIGLIFTLAERLDLYERDELLHRDAETAQSDVARLQRALEEEDDPRVASQIRAALGAKIEQQSTLGALRNRMEQAQFRLEETLTSLGTVYSQFQLVRAQKLDGAGARSLSEEIREQIRGLQDIVDSMGEVYGQSHAGKVAL